MKELFTLEGKLMFRTWESSTWWQWLTGPSACPTEKQSLLQTAAWYFRKTHVLWVLVTTMQVSLWRALWPPFMEFLFSLTIQSEWWWIRLYILPVVSKEEKKSMVVNDGDNVHNKVFHSSFTSSSQAAKGLSYLRYNSHPLWTHAAVFPGSEFLSLRC